MKKRINIHLTDRQCDELLKLSRETGAPMAELIRRAIDAYLGVRNAATPAAPVEAPAPASAFDEAEFRKILGNSNRSRSPRKEGEHR